VLSNESQAIPAIQVSPKKPHLKQHLKLWVIESFVGRSRPLSGDNFKMKKSQCPRASALRAMIALKPCPAAMLPPPPWHAVPMVE
jgi:hypothetical protein